MSAAERNPVGPLELQARQLLTAAGCLWMPAWYNSNVTPPDARPRFTIPTGNAHVLFAQNLFALDVDADAGLVRYYDLLDMAEATLSWHSVRGPKAVLRLPEGAPALQHGAHPYAGLEILTRKALAPGSTKNGCYYPVETLNPIATIPMDVAVELAKLAPGKAPEPRSSGLTFIMEAVPWSREWRSDQHVRRPQRDQTVHLEPTADAMHQRALWHNETRQGERWPAVKRIALQMARYSETYLDFKTEILSHPVRKALEGRGDTDVVLGRVWTWAEREIAATTGVRREPAIDLARPVEAARTWWSYAQAVIDLECAEHPQRHRNLSDLVRMHASWLQRFGFDYYLPYRLMLAYLGMNSASKLTTYIEMLEQMTLLQRRHDKRARQVDGMRWTLLINNVELCSALTPTALITLSSFPPADLRVLDDEEIDWLLGYARRLEDEAARRKRQNARSERITQVRTRLAAAEERRQNER